jgi:hypothetical protein
MPDQQLSLFPRAMTAACRDRTKARNHSPEKDDFRRDHARRRSHGLALRHARKRCRLHGCSDECRRLGLHDESDPFPPFVWPEGATLSRRPPSRSAKIPARRAEPAQDAGRRRHASSTHQAERPHPAAATEPGCSAASRRAAEPARTSELAHATESSRAATPPHATDSNRAITPPHATESSRAATPPHATESDSAFRPGRTRERGCDVTRPRKPAGITLNQGLSGMAGRIPISSSAAGVIMSPSGNSSRQCMMPSRSGNSHGRDPPVAVNRFRQRPA